MDKIINKKRYNTKTAKLIATGYSGSPRNDYHYWEEQLYRKQTGEYFLYGWGNAASRYSKAVGQNEWKGSEKIQPLTHEAARLWAEKHMEAEEYLKHFEADPEYLALIRQTVIMTTQLNNRLREHADGSSKSISEVVIEALEAHLPK